MNAAEQRGTPVWLIPALVAAAIRIPIACVANDQWGDAPVRFDILEAWVRHPGLWWSFDRIYQYGPLPTHLAGVLALTGLGPFIAARALVVLCGVAGVALLAVLAEGFGGAGLVAGLALALSPLHIQCSTTFTSDAVYLAFALACLWRARERDIWGCAAFAYCASTTRYDAWIWLPLLGVWWVWRGFPQRRAHALLGALLLAAGPVNILVANGLAHGVPLAPLRYIAKDHVTLALQAQTWIGTRLWRELMVVFWPGAFIAVLTPAFAALAFWSLWKRIREKSPALLPAALGVWPVALYAFNSVVLGSFWPMARFALGPASFVAVAIKNVGRRTLMVCVVVSLAYNAVLIALGDGKPGIGLFASAASPISLLPSDLRAGSRALREAKGLVVLDYSPGYEDILVAAGAGMNRWRLIHPPAGAVPERIVALEGGALDAALQASTSAFGHAYRLVERVDRVSWWDLVR